MTPQSFVTLAGATAVAVVLAVISSNTAGISGAIADRGDRLFANLAERSKDIGTVEVDLGDTKTVITRDGDAFKDASGFPVRASTVRELTANLALLRIEETKTADKTRHEDLRLAAPDTEKGGERLTLKNASGGIIADVILGERDLTVGGTRGGQFVRRADDDQTYLVRGYVSVPLSRVGWFETQLIEIAEADITAVKAVAGDDNLWSVKRAGSVLVPEGLEDGDKPDTQKVSAIARTIAPLRFSDVRKSSNEKVPPANAKTMTFAAKDGLSLSLTSFNAPKPDTEAKDDAEKAKAEPASSGEGDDTRWVRIAVTSTDKASADKAAELEKRVAGFDFRLSSTDYEKFGWTTADLKTEPQS